MRQIVLASTSPYRRELLTRLGISFDVAKPDVDESRHTDEDASALVRRLAEAKARAVAQRFPEALIIGSDQVAVLGSEILGKPHSHERAVAQLTAASGRPVIFHTGLCLLDAVSGQARTEEVLFRVVFRQLSRDAIENYLQRERPYDCAGSFKSEGLGIALFQRLEGDDPNALIGLPLIRLIDLLAQCGVDVLKV